MARIRRVGKYVTFRPPTFSEGVAQVADCWGALSSITPPRLVYYVKKESRSGQFVCRNSAGGVINSSLSADVRRVGKDMSTCMARYGRQLPPATAEKVRHSIVGSDMQIPPNRKVHQDA